MGMSRSGKFETLHVRQLVGAKQKFMTSRARFMEAAILPITAEGIIPWKHLPPIMGLLGSDKSALVGVLNSGLRHPSRQVKTGIQILFSEVMVLFARASKSV
jgi:hypothetical protein